nr:tetratricopeptide repeat protein [Deltaproteobacteria bacterium]
DKALRDGEFDRAVIEYRRFLDFFPKDERARKARFQIGSAYYKAKRFNDAIAAFQPVIQTKTVDEFSIKSYQIVSECYLKLGQTKQAVSILEKLIDRVQDHNLRDHTYHSIGWIFLERLDFDHAESYFNKISDLNRKKYKIDSLIPDIEKARSIGQKNPATAGMLSVIPGAGYLYLERYQDALISFLVNTALIFAAYEAFDNDLYVLGGIISIVELGFYAGNIYGATTSAHKTNRSQKHDFIEKLKRRTIVGLQPDPRLKGILFSFQYNF